MSIIEKLEALAITLPTPAAPVANYVGYVRTGNLLVVSGQIAFGTDGKIAAEHLGHVGASVSPADAHAAARLCAINLLAQAQAALGSLENIERVVRLGGFVSCTPDFTAIPAVINGASDLMVAVLGDRGRHARAAVGVPSLPLNCCVEVEAIFEIK